MTLLQASTTKVVLSGVLFLSGVSFLLFSLTGLGQEKATLTSDPVNCGFWNQTTEHERSMWVVGYRDGLLLGMVRANPQMTETQIKDLYGPLVMKLTTGEIKDRITGFCSDKTRQGMSVMDVLFRLEAES
jgi:hypothetical protein